MKPWIVEPRDPVVARDGRPFSAVPGARANTLPFPLPSTTAGAARTRAGGEPFDPSAIPRLLASTVRGPFLVDLASGADGIAEIFFPAPGDAQVASEDPLEVRPRLPLDVPADRRTNLPKGLVACGVAGGTSGKPGRAPAFWYWPCLQAWLLNERLPAAKAGDLGCSGPLAEERVHVSVEPGREVAREGFLFATQGLRFEMSAAPDAGAKARRLAILLETDLELRPGLDALGGERRTVAWREATVRLPPCPDGIVEAVAAAKACRIVLATPGCFEAGFRPALRERARVEADLVAAVVPSPLTVSGFDLAANKPKPTRRLARAGSTYFLRLRGENSAIREWVRSTWLASVADRDQDARDGFAVSLVGLWDGCLRSVEET